VRAYFEGASDSAAVIHEWLHEFKPLWALPPSETSPAQLTATVLLLALIAAAFASPRQRVRALVALGLFGLAVLHVRHLDWFGLTAALLLAPALDELLERKNVPSPVAVAGLRWRRVLLPVGAAGLVAFASAWWTRTPAEWIGPQLGGAPFVAAVESLPAGARLYHPWMSGGLALWLGRPRGVTVFFDTRNDCYSGEFAETAFELEASDAPALVPVLQRYGATHALAKQGSALFEALRGSSGWQEERRYEPWGVFRRLVPVERSSMRAAP